MLLDSKLSKYFVHKQVTARRVYTDLTGVRLLGGVRSQNSGSLSNVIISILVRRYLRGSKKTNRKDMLKSLKECPLALRRGASVPITGRRQSSFGVLYLYNLFFWATAASGASSIFRRRDKSITNRFS